MNPGDSRNNMWSILCDCPMDMHYYVQVANDIDVSLFSKEPLGTQCVTSDGSFDCTEVKDSLQVQLLPISDKLHIIMQSVVTLLY